MACSLSWIPDSLYNYSISSVVTNYNIYEKELRTFHGNVIFDIFYKLYKNGLLFQLYKEFHNLNQFEKLLRVSDKRYLLHNCFQALMDSGYQIALGLAEEYENRCLSVFNSSDSEKIKAIHLGFSLGIFLLDAGWIPECELILIACLMLCTQLLGGNTPNASSLFMECHKRLLHVKSVYCKFEDAQSNLHVLKSCIEYIKNKNLNINLSSIYSEFSFYYFLQSQFKKAYKWSVKAINELNSNLPAREIINILCTASKAYVVNKKFKQAELLIKQALHLTKEHFGDRHLIEADTLMHYGYYFLRMESTIHAIAAYEKALQIRNNVLGGKNLLVAIAHEDLAYASYINNYATGRFKDAREHVEKTLHIEMSMLEEDHFLLASSKRVMALILEEIAIDSHDKTVQDNLFLESEELHTSALEITRQYLGDNNLQTGKHYGNLGRLYQSMRKFNESQEMHLKAISIKKEILGPDDYEVAISYGHLASLYNYDLELFDEAEALYLKAISIGTKLFGKGYSGLEYDYRGLLRVYTILDNAEKVSQLNLDFHEWKILRDESIVEANRVSPLDIKLDPIEPDKIQLYLTSM